MLALGGCITNALVRSEESMLREVTYTERERSSVQGYAPSHYPSAPSTGTRLGRTDIQLSVRLATEAS